MLCSQTAEFNELSCLTFIAHELEKLSMRRLYRDVSPTNLTDIMKETVSTSYNLTNTPKTKKTQKKRSN